MMDLSCPATSLRHARQRTQYNTLARKMQTTNGSSPQVGRFNEIFCSFLAFFVANLFTAALPTISCIVNKPLLG